MNDIKHRTEGVSGFTGLVAAIIATAEYDVLKGKGHIREDAIQYFRSDTYKLHLDFLDMPKILPPRIKDMV